MSNPLIDIKNLRRSSFKRTGDMFKGTTFENYFDPIEVIGVGAFASVISARSKEDGSLLAIKILKKKKIGDTAFSKLEKEAEILSQFKHKNIIDFKYSVLCDHHFFIVMELFEGQTLEQYIQQRRQAGTPLTEPEARSIIIQLLEAIKTSHENDIVHRDLKPDNIMIKEVNGQLQLKVIDFGLSHKPEGMRASTHENCGTLLYQAPELAGDREYNSSVDIWSLGIILYKLFSDWEHPFYKGETPKQYLKKLSSLNDLSDLYFPETMPEAAIDLFKRTCSPQFTSRLSAQQALQHSWITGNQENPWTIEDMITYYKSQQKIIEVIKAMMFINLLKKKGQQVQGSLHKVQYTFAPIVNLNKTQTSFEKTQLNNSNYEQFKSLGITPKNSSVNEFNDWNSSEVSTISQYSKQRKGKIPMNSIKKQSSNNSNNTNSNALGNLPGSINFIPTYEHSERNNSRGNDSFANPKENNNNNNNLHSLHINSKQNANILINNNQINAAPVSILNNNNNNNQSHQASQQQINSKDLVQNVQSSANKAEATSLKQSQIMQNRVVIKKSKSQVIDDQAKKSQKNIVLEKVKEPTRHSKQSSMNEAFKYFNTPQVTSKSINFQDGIFGRKNTHNNQQQQQQQMQQMQQSQVQQHSQLQHQQSTQMLHNNNENEYFASAKLSEQKIQQSQLLPKRKSFQNMIFKQQKLDFFNNNEPLQIIGQKSPEVDVFKLPPINQQLFSKTIIKFDKPPEPHQRRSENQKNLQSYIVKLNQQTPSAYLQQKNSNIQMKINNQQQKLSERVA